MSSQAKVGYGAKLQLETASVYNSIEELTSISGPSQKAKSIDVTNMDSLDAYAEYINGIIDAGTVSVEGNWTNATQQLAFLTAFQSRAAQNFKILLPGTQPAAGSFTFAGIITEHSVDFKVSDKISWKGTIQVSGPVTYATS